MTHAECQDLLLDLAYGELDAIRAAEVQSHLAGCADCQRDQAQIAETRRMASPLRAVEEPSPGFDARILAAARAEANLQSGGLPGQVIEVKGSVQPMGLQAARIDAHAAVKTAPAKRKPRWGLRVALGGSVAAAAALALVMSTTLQSRNTQKQATAQYEIQVEKVAQKAQREALAKAEQSKSALEAAPATTPAPPPPVAEERRDEKKAKHRAPAKAAADELVQGGGGDVAETAGRMAGHAAGGAGASNALQAPMGAAAEPVAAEAPPPQAAPRAAMKSLGVAQLAAKDDQDASAVESRAQAARHAADYVLAASLYRSAAALRQSAAGKEADKSFAAWDLAHAVECLAAAGLFDQARDLQAELQRTYPGESTPLMAANRALRAGYVPAAATSAAPAEAKPPAKPTPKAADEAQGH